jgi:hypothetical protein
LLFALDLFLLGKLLTFFDNLSDFDSLLLSGSFVSLLFICFFFCFFFLAFLCLYFLFLRKQFSLLYQQLELLLGLFLLNLRFLSFGQTFLFNLFFFLFFPRLKLFLDLCQLFLSHSFFFLSGQFLLKFLFEFSLLFCPNLLDLLLDELFLVDHASLQRFRPLLLGCVLHFLAHLPIMLLFLLLADRLARHVLLHVPG